RTPRRRMHSGAEVAERGLGTDSRSAGCAKTQLREFFFSAICSRAPAVSIARRIAGGGGASVTMVNLAENGAVRLSARRPNLELSRAKRVRSAAAIMRRWAATMRAL